MQVRRVMNSLPEDLLREIGLYLNTRERVWFSMVDKITYKSIIIEEISSPCGYYLTDAILKQPRFSMLRLLDLSFIGIIGRHARTSVTDDGIKNLRHLEVLHMNNIPTITQIGHMTELRELSISGDCGVSNESLLPLKKLVKLDISNNRKITDINHLYKLKVLHADSRPVLRQGKRKVYADYESCVMTNAGFDKLDSLEELHALNTHTITRQIGDVEKERERCEVLGEEDRFVYNEYVWG